MDLTCPLKIAFAATVAQDFGHRIMWVKQSLLDESLQRGDQYLLEASTDQASRSQLVDDALGVLMLVDSLLPVGNFFQEVSARISSNRPLAGINAGSGRVLFWYYPNAEESQSVGSSTFNFMLPPDTWIISPSEMLLERNPDAGELMLIDEDLGPSSADWASVVLGQIGECETHEHLHRPLRHLLETPSPIGILLRRTFPDQISRGSKSRTAIEDSSSPFGPEDVHIITVTTERLKSVRKLLASIRTFWGWKIPVSCVVQRSPSKEWIRLGKKYDCELVFVERDLGLAASRNLLVEKVSENLIFLMDDDFEIDERSRLDVGLKIFDLHPEVNVLGGNLLDVRRHNAPRSQEVSQGFAMRMLKRLPEVVWLRLEDGPRKREFIDELYYVEECDIVDNFAIFRREFFSSPEIHWNPELKIGAEHQDLYIRCWDSAARGIYRTNALRVRNVRIQDQKFRGLRQRTNQFFPKFFRALNLAGFEIIGERRRVVASDGGAVLSENQGRSLKYFGGPR
jgi:hypothetical protein